jgi:excisionase family DNA binding protein
MNLNNRRISAVEAPEMSSDEIMNIKEVSHYLKIPVSTVYKLVQDRKVPAVKLGKHWRFMKKDLDHLFEQRKPEIFK